MITAVLFLIATFIFCALSLTRGPFWGLFAYANVYFNNPDPRINWWAENIPDLRWSLIIAIVLLASTLIHRKKLSSHKFSYAYWVFLFYVLTEILTLTIAVSPGMAQQHSYYLLTYCVIIFFLIKSLANFRQLRLFVLIIIGFTANLGLKAIAEGKLIHDRLENIGPADAISSNEFGVMLAAIAPLVLAFIVRGNKLERVLCLLSLPLLINAFVMCSSRGAFVSLAAGIIYAFFIVANTKVKKYMLVAGIIILPLFLATTNQSFRSRMATIWEADMRMSSSLNEVSTGRMETWEDGLKMLKDYPMGAGPEGFRALSRFYMAPDNLSKQEGYEYGVRAAHNSYLQVLIEQGYAGFIIYMIICIGTARLLLKSARKIKRIEAPGSFMDLFVLSLNMSFAVSLMGGMFGAQVYYEFFWWQVAMSIVLYSFVNKQGEESSEGRELPAGTVS